MVKKFITNTIYSFLTLLLMSLIFTLGGFLALDLFNPGVIILFCAVLCLGYFIGRKLHYTKGIGFISIVLVPMIVFTVLFALCIVGVPVISMLIQYPAAVWYEAVNVRADDYPVMFYVIAFVHYLICSMSLFAGTCVSSKQ